MVPPHKWSRQTVRRRLVGPPDQISQPYPATNGPNPGMVLSRLADVDECTKKAETVQSALGWVLKAS